MLILKCPVRQVRLHFGVAVGAGEYPFGEDRRGNRRSRGGCRRSTDYSPSLRPSGVAFCTHLFRRKHDKPSGGYRSQCHQNSQDDLSLHVSSAGRPNKYYPVTLQTQDKLAFFPRETGRASTRSKLMCEQGLLPKFPGETVVKGAITRMGRAADGSIYPTDGQIYFDAGQLQRKHYVLLFQ